MALQFGQLSGVFHLKFFHLTVNNVSALGKIENMLISRCWKRKKKRKREK